MRACLLSLLLAWNFMGCARTEVLEAPQGPMPGSTTSRAATASGATASSTGTGTGTGTTATASHGAATGGPTSSATAAASSSGAGTVGTSGTGTTGVGITNTTGGPASSSATSTSGTSGGGGECAPCNGNGDCAAGGTCIPDRTGSTFCTGACTVAGATCPDAASVCFPVGANGQLGCFPQTLSCVQSSSATATGTVGTSGASSTIGTATATGTVASATGSGATATATASSSTGTGTVASSTGGVTTTTGGVTTTTGGVTTTTGGVTTTTGTRGVSATASASSTGTSGGTTGGADCTTLGCPAGESCSTFPGSAGPYSTCTCSQATANTPSSCASNADGTTVCDANTSQCRLPRDFERCNRGPGAPSCQGGYSCIFGFCIQPCASTADCSATFTHCVDRVGQGYCEPNRCGPRTGNGDYYQPCTVSAAGDGTCQPFVDANGQVMGYCLANGPTPTGAPCPGFGVDKPQQCVAGDLCFAVGGPPPDGGTSARCYDTCNANPAGGYPRACSNGAACFTNSPPTSTPDPGICYP